MIRKTLSFAAFTFALLFPTNTAVASAQGPARPTGADNFYKSDQVIAEKVTFKNQYNLKVAGNLFVPKSLDKNVRWPAIVVGHPMGAVKEQSSSLYAQKLAEQGFVTLAIDLSFWGESEGEPRNLAAPEIYAEDFSAAVDFLGTRPFVDRQRIGGLGICGSGSFVISAAKIDPRLKAVATVSMYDMGAAARNGLRKSQTLEQRRQMLAAAAEQRYVEFTGGETKYVGGTVLELAPDTDPVQREFFDFYRTPRGEFTPRGSSRERATKPTLSSIVRFTSYYPFEEIETISPRPMLFITGDEAHSREFSEDAFRRAAMPKELYIVRGAGHVDLYDRTSLIPFDKLVAFFGESLKMTAVATRLATPEAKTMIITRSGSRPTVEGPSETFTGTVHVTPRSDANDTMGASSASVLFSPRARSAWHTHPRGQLLIVTAGVGRVQQWGGAVEAIGPGDVIWTPRGVKHWHGASPTASMTHLAIQESLDGKAVNWMEKVSDAQYQIAPGSTKAAGRNQVSDTPSDARKAFGDIAPALADYTDEVLFGDVWKRTDLSPRDRSLITVAALVAGYRTNELAFHLKKALDNGLSKDELIGLITHLAFYSGWPTANTALPIARRVFQENP